MTPKQKFEKLINEASRINAHIESMQKSEKLQEMREQVKKLRDNSSQEMSVFTHGFDSSAKRDLNMTTFSILDTTPKKPGRREEASGIEDTRNKPDTSYREASRVGNIESFREQSPIQQVNTSPLRNERTKEQKNAKKTSKETLKPAKDTKKDESKSDKISPKDDKNERRSIKKRLRRKLRRKIQNSIKFPQKRIKMIKMIRKSIRRSLKRELKKILAKVCPKPKTKKLKTRSQSLQIRKQRMIKKRKQKRIRNLKQWTRRNKSKEREI